MLKITPETLMSPESSFERISPTAMFVGFLRAESGMPWAKEIAQEAKAEQYINQLLEGLKKKVNIDQSQIDALIKKFAPQMELRQLSITNFLKSKGIKNILEVASGLSNRGIEMTADPEINYIESDLPKIISEKEKISKKLIGGRQNLHYEIINALSLSELEKAIQNLNGPIAMVNEGLLGYFTREEKLQLAQNFRTILKEKGGIWVTTDFTTSETSGVNLLDKDLRNAVNDAMQALTGRFGSVANQFADQEDINNFIEEAGFDAQVLNQLDFAQGMASWKNLNIDQEEIKGILAKKTFHVLTPK